MNPMWSKYREVTVITVRTTALLVMRNEGLSSAWLNKPEAEKGWLWSVWEVWEAIRTETKPPLTMLVILVGKCHKLSESLRRVSKRAVTGPMESIFLYIQSHRENIYKAIWIFCLCWKALQKQNKSWRESFPDVISEKWMGIGRSCNCKFKQLVMYLEAWSGHFWNRADH